MTYINFLQIIARRLDGLKKDIIDKVVNYGEDILNDEEIEILENILEEYSISNCPNCGEFIDKSNYEDILFIYDEGMCASCKNNYDNIINE